MSKAVTACLVVMALCLLSGSLPFEWQAVKASQAKEVPVLSFEEKLFVKECAANRCGPFCTIEECVRVAHELSRIGAL